MAPLLAVAPPYSQAILSSATTTAWWLYHQNCWSKSSKKPTNKNNKTNGYTNRSKMVPPLKACSHQRVSGKPITRPTTKKKATNADPWSLQSRSSPPASAGWHNLWAVSARCSTGAIEYCQRTWHVGSTGARGYPTVANRQVCVL